MSMQDNDSLWLLHGLSRSSGLFKEHFDRGTETNVERLDLQSSSINREHQSVDRIKSALGKHGNRFSIEGNLRYNLSTQTFIPNENV